MSAQPPAAVLARYPHVGPTVAASLGSAGGFSGASIWKVTTPSESWCLKAWPITGPSPDRLIQIHRWIDQARAAGLSYVPAVARTSDGSTIVEHAGRLWDVCEWMPGSADFHSRPTPARIEAACVALARLHLSWRAGEPTVAEPTSVQRRIQTVAEWLALVNSGWRPRFAPAELDPVSDAAQTAWAILPQLVPTVGPALAAWVGRRLPLHPCLCDIWADHVLFTGDEVTGIIDYGEMRLDYCATDLARLLGDLAGRDHSLYDSGLSAYARAVPLSSADRSLVRALCRTGAILAAARWLLRLYRDHEHFADRPRVAARLRAVVARIAHEA